MCILAYLNPASILACVVKLQLGLGCYEKLMLRPFNVRIEQKNVHHVVQYKEIFVDEWGLNVYVDFCFILIKAVRFCSCPLSRSRGRTILYRP